jgi:hypothetical protein
LFSVPAAASVSICADREARWPPSLAGPGERGVEERADNAPSWPAPLTAGLLSSLPLDSGIVDRALQWFLAEVDQVGQALTSRGDDPLSLFILVGATGAAAVACELARRQVRGTTSDSRGADELLSGIAPGRLLPT